MLYWHANFQIPNSGVQTADVYIVAELDANSVKSFAYSDSELKHVIFNKEYFVTGISDPYDYLLSLDEYAQYTKI